jgi:hypothetical protein
VNGDLTKRVLRRLDERAARLNISCQAVIRTLLDQALPPQRHGKPLAKRDGVNRFGGHHTIT